MTSWKASGLALLVLFSAVSIGLLPGTAHAQVLYGSIVGTVEDPTGAVIPKATISITNKDTGVTREATADEAGRYSLLNVPAGTYEAKISAAGFRPVIRTDVVVQINIVSRVDVTLEVGAVTESVTVAGTAAMLTTDKADVHTELSTRAVTQLPLGGYRNYQTLLDLVPGATPTDYQNAVVDTPARALTTNVNGTARNNNNTLVDGAVNVFIWLPHHTAYVPPVESIDTVNITTGSFDAEQGMAGGAAITVATKSGTNEMHGTVSWYHNDQHLNARPYFYYYPNPKSILNQGGGTLGGAVIKNKLFYFGSFERTMERTGNAGSWSTPPQDFRNGDFSKWTDYSIVYDPASSPDPAKRIPFENNTIPKNRISSIFDQIQKLAPMPNQVSPTDPNNLQGTFAQSGTLVLNRNMQDYKVNYNATSKLMVWGKYSRMDAPVHGVPVFGELMGPMLGTAGVGSTTTQLPTFGVTYTFSPTFIVDGTFGYTRMEQSVVGQDNGKNWGLDVFGIPGTNGGTQYAGDKHYSGVPTLENFGFTYWGNADTWVPLERHERTYAPAVNFTKIHGAHDIRWGFEARRLQMDHWQPETANPRGDISFASGATITEGQTAREPNQYAAALLGLVGSYSKSIQYLMMSTREWQFATYVRDRWQVNRNLTLNLGLRYEYYPLMNRGDRGLERWDPATNLVYIGGYGGQPWDVGIKVSKRLFAPRVGIAYRIGEKTVIRTGYGLTYDPLPFSRPLRGPYPSTLTGNWSAANPNAAFQNENFGWYNTLADGIPPVPTPDISSGIVSLPLDLTMGPRSPWGGMLHRGYIQSWNFTVEHKLPMDAVASVGYVATRTIHQMLDRDINTSAPGTGVEGMALYGTGRTVGMNMWDGIGYGSYNSLQATLNKSFSRGLYAKLSYTYGKAMNMGNDDGWDGLNMWSWGPMVKRNYAPADYDRRQMFVMGWVYELPVGEGRKYALKGVADKVLGGWKINGTFAAYTGTPFTIWGDWASINCYGCSQTADQILPNVDKPGQLSPGKPYYDPTAFRDPYWNFNGVYRPGSTGRNLLYGPGYWRINPAMYKDFKLTERFTMEFRAEAQNFTNTPAWGNPNSSVSDMQLNPDGTIKKLNNFLTSTWVQDRSIRQFRFGMRLSF